MPRKGLTFVSFLKVERVVPFDDGFAPQQIRARGPTNAGRRAEAEGVAKMASTHQEYVFRFFTVRSGNLEAKVERAPRRLLVYSTDRPTELGKKLQQLHDSGASQAEIQRVIVAFQGSPNHVKSLRALSFDVQRGLD